MSWIILIIALVALVAIYELIPDHIGMLWISACIVWTGCAVVMAGTHLFRDYDQRECRSYAEQTEREVQFIQTGYWDWGCYVQTDEGWIEKGNIVKVEEGA